jgi:hypothetical protein
MGSLPRSAEGPKEVAEARVGWLLNPHERASLPTSDAVIVERVLSTPDRVIGR